MPWRASGEAQPAGESDSQGCPWLLVHPILTEGHPLLVLLWGACSWGLQSMVKTSLEKV